LILAALATYRWARLADLEHLSRVPADRLRAEVGALPAVRECVVLSTCHRIEVYVAFDDAEAASAQVRDVLARHAHEDRISHLVRWRRDAPAAEHLLRVAAGLDSMVVGEAEVLGQVAEAYESALAEGAAGRELTLLFHRAIAAGKRVRTETGLAKGAVSLGSAAVRLAAKHLGSLERRGIVVVGTGEMAGLVARALAAEGARVTIASRHVGRAQTLAAEVEGTAASAADLGPLLGRCDAAVFATSGPRVLFEASRLRTWLRTRDRPLLVLDLANPRNVDPAAADLPGVRLLDLDSLRGLRQETLAQRRAEAARARALLREELVGLRELQAEMRADQVLRALYLRGEEVRSVELQRAFARLGALPEDQRAVVEDLAASLVRKVLAAPTAALRALARTEDDDAVRLAARLLGVPPDDPHPPPAKASPP
jgi:glutamyl-tRNA reductase